MGCEVDDEGRVLEGPGEEEDLEGRGLGFGGADAGDDCFEVVGYYAEDAVAACGGCVEHLDGAVGGEGWGHRLGGGRGGEGVVEDESVVWKADRERGNWQREEASRISESILDHILNSNGQK